MSWQDRPYGHNGESPEIRIQFRRPSTAVMWLLIANVAIFFIDTIVNNFTGNIIIQGELSLYTVKTNHYYLGLSLLGIKHLYFWQPLTYMFMHAGTIHLLVNMLGLYIFGSEFERTFGRDRFLQFYGTCGIIGGLAYLALGAVGGEQFALLPVVGASGAIYGLLIAAIIFFPHIRVVLIIFPMPIRVFGLIIAAILLLQLLAGKVENPGGEVCHIAGALTGLAFFYTWGIMPRISIGSDIGWFARHRQGAWEKKQQKLAAQREEVDRILAKVHEAGLASLTRREKKTLADATRIQQEQDRRRGRTDRL